MKILITGFNPFGGETVNPAYEAVKLLPEEIGGAKIVKKEIPTEFIKAGEVLKETMTEHKPDAVICVGQAGGRAAITIEKVAINLMDGAIPDNAGYKPVDEPIQDDGDTAYFTSLPIKAMVKKMHEAGIPAGVSYTAGTYVCNYLFYSLMYLIDHEFDGVRGGFIHVPFATEQAVGKSLSVPSMELGRIAKALEKAVEAVVENKTDIKVSMGATH